MLDLPPILAHLVELIALLLLTLIAVGVGLRLLALLRAAAVLSLGERLIFGMALGYGALGFAMLGMGLLGVLYLPVGLAIVVIFALVGYAPLMREGRRFAAALPRMLAALRYPTVLFLSVVIALCVFAALIKALVPVATQDDLMYHLALPQRYIDAHAIQFYPDSTYSLFPQLMEMLYTWGLLLGSDRLAVLFALSAGLIGPVAGALFAKRYLMDAQPTGAMRALPLLVPALFLSVPLVGYVLRAANTDLAQASFDLLGAYAFWLAVWGAKRPSVEGQPAEGGEQPEPTAHPVMHTRLLLLAGICCGLSFSTKYYGFAVGLSLGVALLAIALYRGRRGKGQRLKSVAPGILAFVGGAVATSAPWLIRNLVEAGNPVWPLAGAFFGGAYWAEDASPEALLGRAPSEGVANIWTGLEYMWVATTRPTLLIERQWHEVNLGYLLLPAILLLPAARWRPALRWLVYVGGAYWLLWALFFSRTSARYLSTFFLLAALVGAYAVVSLPARYRPARWLLAGVVSALLAILSIQAAISTGPFLSTALALDRHAEAAYLTRDMEDYPMMRYIAANLPANAHIYLWDGQPRGYYVKRDLLYARLVPVYSGFGLEPLAWRQRLTELGITHVLVHQRDILAPGQPLGVDPALEIGRRFGALYFGVPLFTSGNFTLYPLK